MLHQGILNITIDQLYSKEYHFILTRDSMQDDSFYLVKTPLSRFDIDSVDFDCKGLFDESTVYKGKTRLCLPRPLAGAVAEAGGATLSLEMSSQGPASVLPQVTPFYF